MSATHVGYLVNPKLELGYPAVDKFRQEVLGRHTLFLELGDDLVNLVDLWCTHLANFGEIGRASCRERVCLYV